MPLLPKTQDERRSYGQRHRRGRRYSTGRHSLCALVHTEGQQQRDGWLWGAAAPFVDGAPYASKRDVNTPMTTNHREAILHVRWSWHKSKADFQAKMNDWDRPNRAMPMGRLKFKKKLGPTDRQSGSIQTMTPPRHADKDCLTTEENVTISSSRIIPQGHCRCGAAESPLARNHQPTRTTGDTRIVSW